MASRFGFALVCGGALSIVVSPGKADILEVPNVFSTVQAAIDFAQDGDTIRVFTDFPDTTSIDFRGKAITIESIDRISTFGTSYTLSNGGVLRATGQQGGGEISIDPGLLRVPPGAYARAEARDNIEIGDLQIDLGGTLQLSRLSFNPIQTLLGNVLIQQDAALDVVGSDQFDIVTATMLPGSMLLCDQLRTDGPFIANGTTINILNAEPQGQQFSLEIECCGPGVGEPGSGWVIDNSSLFSAGGMQLLPDASFTAFDSDLFLLGDLTLDGNGTELIRFFDSAITARDIVFQGGNPVVDLVNSDLSIRDFTIPGGGIVRGSGEWITQTLTNNGDLLVTDTTIITGDVTNDGTITVQLGTTTIAGTFMNNGTVLGDLVGPLGGMSFAGSFVATSGASFTTTSDSFSLDVNGSFDIAIDDRARFNLSSNALSVGGLPDATMEMMGADLGPTATGLDPSIEGNFPIGSLTLRGSTDLVDFHGNSVTAVGEEAIYVENLTIASGADIQTNGLRIYYRNLDLVGVVDDPGNLIQIVDLCPGDCDNDGSVDFSDLVAMLSDFGTPGTSPGCDADASGAVDFGDLVTALGVFGPCP